MSHPASLESLDAIGIRHGTDKSSVHNDFLRFYAPFLERRRSEAVRVLEIGVLGGGSVRTWADYFPRGEIIGADIDPGAKQYASGRICIEIADQSDPNDRARLAALGPFDVVIDDGSHVWAHQIATFKTLIGSVQPGGLYIVEDLDTSYGKYIPDYQGAGGISAAEYLKRLSDLIVGHRVLPAPNADPIIGPLWQMVEAITFYRGAALMLRSGRACAALPGWH